MSKLKEEERKVLNVCLGEPIARGQGGKRTSEEKDNFELNRKNEKQNSVIKSDEEDVHGNEILKFTMLINKFNSDLELKKSGKNGEESKGKRDVKCAMFFNKEVTIRGNVETPSPSIIKDSGSNEAAKMESKHSFPVNSNATRYVESISGLSDVNVTSPLESIQENDVDFPSKSSVCFGPADGFTNATKVENTKKLLSKRNSKCNTNAEHIDLRIHNSLTSLSKNIKLGLKGVLKSRIPSMTAIETSSMMAKTGGQTLRHWKGLDGETEGSHGRGNKIVEERLNLQISKSNNDNNRRSAMRFKKEDTGSVSDSKLLNTDSDFKKHIKKCDKKSRGDSAKKEADVIGVKKQVQWKTEVDVIYFSTHLAANRDQAGEVIGRVMEPLREEWEQQRKGFYAKIVPYHIESHLKDHFISLLKI